jgi:hypothetical protein
VEGRKKKWKRKAMNEDEGRSDQLGLALVFERETWGQRGAKPPIELPDRTHTRHISSTSQTRPDQTALTKSPAPVGTGVTERGSIILRQ